MKELHIENKDGWKNYIISEAKYNIPDECYGGICVDAGCNIGDFEINCGNRFDKYICYDVFQENVDECVANTKNLGIDIEVYKLAVWSDDDKFIPVYAYIKDGATELQYFGNSGDVGCVNKLSGENGGWKDENVIDMVNTISIDTIIKKYGVINLLKIDVEGSEYEFLLGKDLSNIKYIIGEFHFEISRINELIEWISNTHNLVYRGGTHIVCFILKDNN